MMSSDRDKKEHKEYLSNTDNKPNLMKTIKQFLFPLEIKKFNKIGALA